MKIILHLFELNKCVKNYTEYRFVCLISHVEYYISYKTAFKKRYNLIIKFLFINMKEQMVIWLLNLSLKVLYYNFKLKQWFFQEFFLGGLNFTLAASLLAYLFLLASLAKKLKHQGRSQDFFPGLWLVRLWNFL